MSAALTNLQILNRLVVLAEDIIPRRHGALDRGFKLLDLGEDIEIALRRPAEDVRVIDHAELILIRSLIEIAGGEYSDVDYQRWRAIAEVALAMVRDHLFIALEQERRPTP